MDPSKVYHDSDLQPPHDYVAFYAWLRESFEADAVVHLGTHGSLEWLPGKTVGLNGESAPDQLVSDLPNVYPYIINNPGEGTQAKRRSYAAIVDYLTPVMRTAGTYDDLADLEELADRYREAGMDDARTDDGEHLAEQLRRPSTNWTSLSNSASPAKSTRRPTYVALTKPGRRSLRVTWLATTSTLTPSSNGSTSTSPT